MSVIAEELIRRHRLTVQDYRRIAEAGVFQEGERVELINGEIIDMSPIGSRHAAAVDYLNRLLNRHAGENATVRVQNPLVLGDKSEPEPDIAVVRFRSDYYAAEHPSAGDVLFIIEVAESSGQYDRDIKIPLYALHGIQEAWIVNLQEKRVDIYREPQAGAYRSVTHHSEGCVGSTVLPTMALDVADLFGAK